MDLNEASFKMQKAFEIVRQDLLSVRTGRATPALIENISVMVYGGTQKLRIMELGTIFVSDPRTLTVTPFDPSITQEIQKGILEANIGLTPVVDDEVIRISIPTLSEERRQEYIKLAKQKLEAGKIMIRQVRHEMINDLKRAFEAKEISEDDLRRYEKELQEITDRFISEIDELGRKKEEELLQI